MKRARVGSILLLHLGGAQHFFPCDHEWRLYEFIDTSFSYHVYAQIYPKLRRSQYTHVAPAWRLKLYITTNETKAGKPLQR
jgi:hypothetical protein